MNGRQCPMGRENRATKRRATPNKECPPSLPQSDCRVNGLYTMNTAITSSNQEVTISDQKNIQRQYANLVEEREALHYERQLWRSMLGTVKALRKFYQFDPSAKAERKMIRETMEILAPRVALLECRLDANLMERLTLELSLSEEALLMIAGDDNE